ncbi:DNA internalization-related competence protein ComEC/Rec2 [Uliginosibacterium sp. H1]|nr:DNA internalization-related competence protein ComEC/Rec2 [Uliginosibacterium sp. H1]
MLFLTLGFALGVALCQQQAVLAPSWPALCGIALAGGAAWMLRSRPRALAASLVVLGLCAGFGWADWRAGQRLAEGLPQALEGGDFTVSGYIADLPQRTERGWRFVLRIEDPPAGIPPRLLLSWYAQGASAAPVLRAGESWQLRVRLRRPHGNLNPHGFDYEAWLFERGIRAVGYVRGGVGAAGDNRLLATRAAGFVPALQATRQAVRERFEQTLPDGQWRGVLSALAIGDQGAVPAAQWDLFARTGVTHLMSISGLHVTLVAALVGMLAGALWRRSARLCLVQPAQRITVLAGALAATLYVALAGFGVPAQRTLYMLLMAALSLWLRRRGGVSFALACALMLVLLIDPWAVLSAGFWLSFGAVAALLVAARSTGDADAEGMPAQLWWRAGQWLRAQWAITLLTLPLLLGVFQQFSLVSPLANLVAIPVVSLLVTPLALLFAVLPLPALAELAHGLLAFLMQFLQWLAAMPVANWQQAAPPAWLVALCVVAALFALLPRGVPGRWTALLCFVPLLAWSPPRPPPGSFEVRVLDVGQGLAVHLRTASGDWLFDTGARWSEEADSGDRIVLPYLRAVGARRLDGLIVSHDDIDHSGGAASVLQGIPVAWLASSLPVDHVLRRSARRHVDCLRGEGWQRDGVQFSFLHPGDGAGGKDNDRSCVLRVSSAQGSLLIAGDIEAGAERELLAVEAGRLRADVLVVPHHGSRTSSTEAFVHGVSARHAVFTAGYRNRFGHPHPQVLQRYATQGATIWRSDTHGVLHFQFAPSGPEVHAMRVTHRRYWQGR